MDWDARIFRYCERGGDPAFWAEPVNAATNAAFIIAALVAAVELMRTPARRRRVPESLLLLLIIAMGTGSFLFHTYATVWASYADTLPIGMFMLAYLAYALRRLLGLGWLWIALGLAGFIWALKYAGEVKCRVALFAETGAGYGPCLNGTVGYVPALVAMAGIALALAVKRSPAWRYLAAASVVFLASMTCRAIDWEICESTLLAGHRVGTHFLWHVLNATTLYLLALAAIRHGGLGRVVGNGQ